MIVTSAYRNTQILTKVQQARSYYFLCVSGCSGRSAQRSGSWGLSIRRIKGRSDFLSKTPTDVPKNAAGPGDGSGARSGQEDVGSAVHAVLSGNATTLCTNDQCTRTNGMSDYKTKRKLKSRRSVTQSIDRHNQSIARTHEGQGSTSTYSHSD